MQHSGFGRYVLAGLRGLLDDGVRFIAAAFVECFLELLDLKLSPLHIGHGHGASGVQQGQADVMAQAFLLQRGELLAQGVALGVDKNQPSFSQSGRRGAGRGQLYLCLLYTSRCV